MNLSKDTEPINKNLIVLATDLVDRLDCLQRAVAGLRGQVQDFKAEYTEDIAELKQQLQQQYTTQRRVLK
jgi:hypothetical protein